MLQNKEIKPIGYPFCSSSGLFIDISKSHTCLKYIEMVFRQVYLET